MIIKGDHISCIIFQKSEEAKRGPTPEVIDRATSHVPKSKEKPLTANITVGLDVSILICFFKETPRFKS